MPMTRYLPIAALFALLLAGCAAGKSWVDPADPEALYERGKTALDNGYYETAIRHYQELSTRFPFGDHAQQAQLDTAYAYHRLNQPESAIATAEQFIKTYPRHPNVDYAYYVRGLANFGQTRGALDDWLRADPARRDPRSALDSFRYFSELVTRYPDSPYAEDAVQRMVHLRHYLARHELYVADYYMRRGAWVAAANRARYVIETYPRTPAVEEALRLMARAYDKLGLDDLAATAHRVLETNYPATRADSDATDEALGLLPRLPDA
jgi:outer membrane protein assembly factor BamD